ncbi:MAG: hypothetical protein KAT65_11685 [Methanophagales archaeon]|nr:hypothetical protein [Methanophagales archaeon]
MKNAIEKHNEQNPWTKQPIGKEEKATGDNTRFNELFILREIKLKHGLGCTFGNNCSCVRVSHVSRI